MRIAFVLLITLAALTGCGKKGALVLPDSLPNTLPAQGPTATTTK